MIIDPDLKKFPNPEGVTQAVCVRDCSGNPSASNFHKNVEANTEDCSEKPDPERVKRL